MRSTEQQPPVEIEPTAQSTHMATEIAEWCSMLHNWDNIFRLKSPMMQILSEKIITGASTCLSKVWNYAFKTNTSALSIMLRCFFITKNMCWLIIAVLYAYQLQIELSTLINIQLILDLKLLSPHTAGAGFPPTSHISPQNFGVSRIETTQMKMQTKANFDKQMLNPNGLTFQLFLLFPCCIC